MCTTNSLRTCTSHRARRTLNRLLRACVCVCISACHCSLPDTYRLNLVQLHMVHCDLSLWGCTSLLLPWWSGHLYNKVKWVTHTHTHTHTHTDAHTHTDRQTLHKQTHTKASTKMPRKTSFNTQVVCGRALSVCVCVCVRVCVCMCAVGYHELSSSWTRWTRYTHTYTYTHTDHTHTQHTTHAHLPYAADLAVASKACRCLLLCVCVCVQASILPYLPQYVLLHDSDLEDQPLKDYGIVAPEGVGMEVPGSTQPL